MKICIANDPNNLDSDPKDSPNDPKLDPNDPKDDPNNLNSIDVKVLFILQNNPSISRKDLSNKLNVSDSSIKRLLNKLKDDGIIKREGSKRNGKWIINR